LIPAGAGFEEYRDTFVISEKAAPVAVAAASGGAEIGQERTAATAGEGAARS